MILSYGRPDGIQYLRYERENAVDIGIRSPGAIVGRHQGGAVTTISELEQQKTQMLDTLRDWSPARLAYRPAANAWSAVEMLDHIVKVENAITDAARRGLQNPHRIGPRDRLGFLFLDRVFRSNRRVKVPASASLVLPDKDLDLQSVTHRWDASRKELAEFVSGVLPEQMQAGVFRHPVSGWMTVPQILQFFSVHIQHHRFQVDRLRVATEGL